MPPKDIVFVLMTLLIGHSTANNYENLLQSQFLKVHDAITFEKIASGGKFNSDSVEIIEV